MKKYTDAAAKYRGRKPSYNRAQFAIVRMRTSIKYHIPDRTGPGGGGSGGGGSGAGDVAIDRR
jgi:hypothetical protein